MLYVLGYIAVAAFVWRKAFRRMVAHEKAEWGRIDSVDMGMFAFLSGIVALFWPLTLPVYAIYNGWLKKGVDVD